MNKVITINLNGKAYQIEEEGYGILSAYLSEARAKLDGNPDQEEIVKDFEQAIAEKCDKYIHAHKNVVTTDEINTVIKEMGPVDTSEEKDEHARKEIPNPRKRLYRIKEGSWIAGVCNGIAVFFDMDVKVIRLAFIIISIFTHGGLIGLYILMAIFVPAAETNEEKAFARGKKFNANEFIEEMKMKYGKYADKYTDEKYWKQYVEKYTNNDQKYWTSFSKGAWRLSRIVTGIIAIIGSIALAGIAVAYSVALWSLIVHGTIFGKAILMGASPLLVGIFITAIAYCVAWPIRTIVGEARRHTWNITTRKHPLKRITSFILWIIAIGFVVSVGVLSSQDVDRDGIRKPYGVDFWISHHELCIGANYYCGPGPINSDEIRPVRNTVDSFGDNLKMVSLLAPSSSVKTAMDASYGPYLTPELLAAWEKAPSTALGKETSSPWPDSIHINTIVKNPDGSYTVKGEVIELTSNEIEHGGIADQYPVTLTLVQSDNEWRISAASKESKE